MKASTIAKLTTLLAGQLAVGQGDHGGFIADHRGIVTVTSLHITTATRFTTIYLNTTESHNATSSRTSTRNTTTNSLGLPGPRPTAINSSLRPITTKRFFGPNGTVPPDPNSTNSLSLTGPRPTAINTSLRPITTTRFLDPNSPAPPAPSPSFNTVQMTTVCGGWGCAYAPVQSASIIATSSQTTTAFEWSCPTCLRPVGQQDGRPTAAELTVTRGNLAAFGGTPTGRETRCSFLGRNGDGVVTGTRQSCSTVWAVAGGSRTIFELPSASAGR